MGHPVDEEVEGRPPVDRGVEAQPHVTGPECNLSVRTPFNRGVQVQPSVNGGVPGVRRGAALIFGLFIRQRMAVRERDGADLCTTSTRRYR